MDNHIVDIRSNGREAFDLALNIFMGDQMGGHSTVTHTTIVKPRSMAESQEKLLETEMCGKQAPTFVLFKSDPGAGESHIFDQVSPLPYPMGTDIISTMLWTWLKGLPEKQWEEWTDLDGETGPGFRMWSEKWGRIGGNRHAFFAVRPIHAWYSK